MLSRTIVTSTRYLLWLFFSFHMFSHQHVWYLHLPPGSLDIKYGSCDTSNQVPDDIQIIELSWSRQMTYSDWYRGDRPPLLKRSRYALKYATNIWSFIDSVISKKIKVRLKSGETVKTNLISDLVWQPWELKCKRNWKVSWTAAEKGCKCRNVFKLPQMQHPGQYQFILFHTQYVVHSVHLSFKYSSTLHIRIYKLIISMSMSIYDHFLQFFRGYSHPLWCEW